MRYAWVVVLPLFLCVSGCGLVLDLDPDDPQADDGLDAAVRRDGSPNADAGGRLDASDDGDGGVVVADSGGIDASRPKCGDGVLDSELGEECDDGNRADGDGCDHDCLFSCVTADDCRDGDMCNGTEWCDVTAHTCEPGGAVSCEAPDAGHAVSCDPAVGCVLILADADGDGHASTTLGDCGTDCDDSDPTTYFGATERCDAVDHDCDGSEGDATVGGLCYFDGDGDGFGDPLEFVEACVCEGETVGRAGDCSDDHATVNPAQTAWFPESYCDATADALCFDYDCNGIEEKRWTEVAARCRLLGGILGCAPGGWEATVPGCGEEGTWIECEPRLLTCEATRIRRRQECR